jgi:hypothetical protein
MQESHDASLGTSQSPCAKAYRHGASALGLQHEGKHRRIDVFARLEIAIVNADEHSSASRERPLHGRLTQAVLHAVRPQGLGQLVNMPCSLAVGPSQTEDANAPASSAG